MTEPMTFVVSTKWPDDVDRMPIVAANQFAFQVSGSDGPTEVLLTIGNVSPPLVGGGQDEQRQAVVDQGNILTAYPLARYILSAATFREFSDLVIQLRSGIDAAQGGDPE